MDKKSACEIDDKVSPFFEEMQTKMDVAAETLKKNTDIFLYFLFPDMFIDKTQKVFEEIKDGYVGFMLLLDSEFAFEGDQWNERVKFLEKGTRFFFSRFAGALKILKEERRGKYKYNPENGYSIIIYDKNEGFEGFKENYIKFIDGAISAFILAEFLKRSKTRDEEYLDKMFKYAITVGEIFKESSFKVGTKEQFEDKEAEAPSEEDNKDKK